MKGLLPDPDSDAQIMLICPIIHDREFGQSPGNWDRMLAVALADPESYSATKARRIVATARHVLGVLREALAP